MDLQKILSKFERSRVLGQRADQLSGGAPPTVDIGNLQDALAIAELELKLKKMPILIQRTFPNGDVVRISVNNLESY